MLQCTFSSRLLKLFPPSSHLRVRILYIPSWHVFPLCVCLPVCSFPPFLHPWGASVWDLGVFRFISRFWCGYHSTKTITLLRWNMKETHKHCRLFLPITHQKNLWVYISLSLSVPFSLLICWFVCVVFVFWFDPRTLFFVTNTPGERCGCPLGGWQKCTQELYVTRHHQPPLVGMFARRRGGQVQKTQHIYAVASALWLLGCWRQIVCYKIYMYVCTCERVCVWVCAYSLYVMCEFLLLDGCVSCTYRSIFLINIARLKSFSISTLCMPPIRRQGEGSWIRVLLCPFLCSIHTWLQFCFCVFVFLCFCFWVSLWCLFVYQYVFKSFAGVF